MAKKNLRVLLIEDSDDDANLLLRELGRGGYEVEHRRVDTAVKLEEAIGAERWDAVISDYFIPGFGALQAFEILKNNKLDIPFVIVSGAIGAEAAVAAMRFGVHDYMMKDDLTRLLPSIERELREAQIREKKRQAEEMNAAILASAPDAIITLDHLGKMIEFNPAAQKMLGYARDEALGKEFVGLIVPENLWVGRPADSLLGYRIETIATRSDGTHFPAELTLTRTRSGDSPIFAGFIRDLTERKQIEAERERVLVREREALDAAMHAMRLKDEFLANMSHEIRTPLNAVLGMAEILLDTPLGEEQKRFLALIQKAGASLLSIVNDVLDFSKIESGRMALDESVFSARSVLENQIEIQRIQAEKKHISLRCFISPKVPARLFGDSVRFGQVLTNLIGNAIKFTEHGEVSVRMDVAEQEPGVSGVGDSSRVRIRCVVTDTGIGIPADSQECLFQPFMQADGSLTRKYGGTGLGLAICKRIVELMDGRIEVESEQGKGSTFRFSVSLRGLSDAKEKASLAADAHEGARVVAGASNKRILVAEDNEGNRLVLSSQLRKLGYSADVVASGNAALEALSSHSYDLVLLDCQMPVMDGFQTLKRMRSSECVGSRVPVIAITAHAMKADRAKCLASGMDDYILKPTDLNTLSKVIERWLPEDK